MVNLAFCGFEGVFTQYIGLTPFLYLYDTAGSGDFQVGMFHKIFPEMLAGVSIDEFPYLCYDKYVGAVSGEVALIS